MIKSTIFLSRDGWHLEQSLSVFESDCVRNSDKNKCNLFSQLEVYRQ